MPILIDTSILVAATYSKDSNHQAARKFLTTHAREIRIVSAPVLVELFFLIRARMDYGQAITAVDATIAAFKIEPLISVDFKRMTQIMRLYQSAELDYVDTSVVALAERLNITRVATFDRRDFVIFRPTHCAYLELLP